MKSLYYIIVFVIGVALGIFYNKYSENTNKRIDGEGESKTCTTSENSGHSKIIYLNLEPFSSTGLPKVVFNPSVVIPDYTRIPSEDKITPIGKNILQKSTRKILGKNDTGSYSSKESTIPPGGYLPLHRHPVPRIVYNTSEISLKLGRQHQDGRNDTLELLPGSFAVFAPDESGQFHNDFNAGNESAVVIVIELDSSKHYRKLK